MPRKPASHGYVRYTKGCRCGVCREGQRVYMRDYAARRKAAGRTIDFHPERPAAPKRPCSKCGKPTSTARSPQPTCKRCRRGISINKADRVAIYERDSWSCGICGELVDREAHHGNSWAPSLDHIVPRSHGGDDAAGNLRTAHRYCNTLRSNRLELTLDELAS